jgi:hypothetical protein
MSVQYLNDTTVSCYRLYMRFWNMSQLSNQGTWNTVGSQFLSLFPTSLKSAATLSINYRYSASPSNYTLYPPKKHCL